jgi:hypothetical protein
VRLSFLVVIISFIRVFVVGVVFPSVFSHGEGAGMSDVWALSARQRSKSTSSMPP